MYTSRSYLLLIETSVRFSVPPRVTNIRTHRVPICNEKMNCLFIVPKRSAICVVEEGIPGLRSQHQHILRQMPTADNETTDRINAYYTLYALPMNHGIDRCIRSIDHKEIITKTGMFCSPLWVKTLNGTATGHLFQKGHPSRTGGNFTGSVQTRTPA